jgi:sulfur carrier protein ThiS
LYSVLQEQVADYDPALGLEVEMAADARVRDLIDHLEISMDKAPVVACDGRVLKPDAPLKNGSLLQLFQPVAGG